MQTSLKSWLMNMYGLVFVIVVLTSCGGESTERHSYNEPPKTVQTPKTEGTVLHIKPAPKPSIWADTCISDVSNLVRLLGSLQQTQNAIYLDSLMLLVNAHKELHIPMDMWFCYKMEQADPFLDNGGLIELVNAAKTSSANKIIYLSSLAGLIATDGEQSEMLSESIMKLSTKNPCAFKKVHAKLGKDLLSHFRFELEGFNLDEFLEKVDAMQCAD